MTAQMKALIQRVERETTINQSVATLSGGIAAQIQSCRRDHLRLEALAEALLEEHVALARAILANTRIVPSAEPPVRTMASAV